MCQKCEEVIEVLETYIEILKRYQNQGGVCQEAIDNLKEALKIY